MSQCPNCGNQMSYVEQYQQWYCYTCQKYNQPVQAQPAHQQPQQSHQQPQPQQPAQEPLAQPAVHEQPQQPQQQPQHTQPAPVSAGTVPENETIHSPSFTALIFHLKQGESITTEKGAMMYMNRTIEIQTAGRKGGLMKGLVTSALGGESFFVNTYTATQGNGDLAVVGAAMGDIYPIDLTKQPQGMIIQSGAYLASMPNIDLDTKWQGLKGFLSEKDFIMLHASGQGTVWVSSFGGIVEKDLQQGEVLSVDTGHLVAFQDHMEFSVRRVGGWKSTILSGEGLVTDMVGPGKLIMQTRHLPAFVSAIVPYLPKQ